MKVDELLKAHSRYGDLYAAILVSHNGQILYENAFGLANREWIVQNQQKLNLE
jgi:hypothetical protein